MRLDPQPFQTALLFLIVVGWIAILFSGCADKPTPAQFCAGTPEGEIDATQAYIIDGEQSTDRRGTVIVANSEGYCTGTILGPHTVLTAAHCVGLNQVVEVIRGVTGELQATSLTHPDYVIYPYNDLALMYVEETLPEPYIGLYSLSQAAECTEIIIQGYGRGSGGQLHERNASIKKVGWYVIDIHEGACFGDSGGPLYTIVNGVPYLAGSLSVGYDLDCQQGNGYVNLTQYREWIEENTR